MTEAAPVDEQPLWQIAVVEGIFAAAAVGIIYWRQSADDIVFRMPLLTEIAIGVPIGALLGAAAGFGLLHSRLRAHVVRGVLPLRPVTSAVWSIVVLGVLAGLGEELLFRAALQTWIGISWASLLFGLAHSGMARLNEGVSARKVAYLVVATLAGVLLGFLYQAAGLPASISAHAAFDTAILSVLAPAISRAAGAAEVT